MSLPESSSHQWLGRQLHSDALDCKYRCNLSESVTLTIRISDELKADLESAARSADQSVTDYVTRSVKQRMVGQCSVCGRSDVLGTAFGIAFTDFIKNDGDTHRHFIPVIISTIEGGDRRVFRGRILAHQPQDEGMLFLVITDDRIGRQQLETAIPRGLIVGWAHDQDGKHFQSMLDLGYADGNAWVIRGRAVSQRRR